MGQIHIVDPKGKRRYEPCLAGIRGYGFLLVFCGHYFFPNQMAEPGTIRFQFLTVLSSLGMFAVPSFFVLSGYLIGGILYHTRNREGFFKVFYSRRILRVFPVYYVTLIAIGIFYIIKRMPIDSHYWTYFLYIQNLLPGPTERHTFPVVMIHFWSLAVEEQFYLLFPLVIWLFRDRQTLIKIVTALIGICFLVRIAAPFLSLSALEMSFFTPTRVDAILMGVLLSLVCETRIYRQVMPYAKWATLSGILAMALFAYSKGELWSRTYAGKEVWIPLGNFTAVAIIIAVMEEGSILNRLCSQRWICWLGVLSYGLYVFHLTFSRFFLYELAPRFGAHMGRATAMLAVGALGFGTTLILAVLSYYFIEEPFMKLKGRVQYGSERTSPSSPQEMGERILVETGT